MPPTSQGSASDAVLEKSTPVMVVRTQVPSFIIDTAAAGLLDANAAGWSAWGLDPATAAGPVALDASMPALRRLREIVAAGCVGSQAHETLVFWTARGAVAMACRIAPHERSEALLRVQALHATAGGKPQRVSPVKPLRCADTLAGIDVALDAWLAHELRTPLSAVIAYAEILKNEHFGPLASPRYKTYAQHIYDSARHALGVADSMLRGDRARSALPSLAFVDLDPRGVVEHCLTVARPLADRAGILLGAEMPERLPRVVADEQSLRQMLLNLLSNAIKYARRGDRVIVAVDYDGDGPLVLVVADNGPGIGEGASANEGSLGLGLPLTRALAAANGATLTIESAAGRGTRVAITFGKDRVVPV
jgi:signal transduction histidine kinase